MEQTWQRTSTAEPYLSWYLIVRNAERTLEATLRSIRERSPEAEIVVVDTMSSDRSPEIARRYADTWIEWTGPHGDWTREMAWFDDAAAAREKAMSLCRGKWLAWIDADDRLAGPEEAEKLLKVNGRWKPVAPRMKVMNGHEGAISLEDALRQVEQELPDVDWIWAPYLYQREPDGTAVVWQERERFVKRSEPMKYYWVEAAHDVLVAVRGHFAPRAVMAHLLYVHERDFSSEAVEWSMRRHWDVLTKQYERGQRTTRRCVYLAEYAKTFAPEREMEFIRAAHDVSTIPLDRFRCKLQEGIHFAERGLHQDALEAFGAAIHVRPDLGDAWIAGGERWAMLGDHARAVEWLERGLALPYNSTDSYLKPRDLVVRYPGMLSNELRKLAALHVQVSRHDEALVYMKRATANWLQVRDRSEIGDDWREAQAYLLRTHNEEESQEQAMALARLAEFLFQNDEPLKVRQLVDAAPWMIKDHPLVQALEARLRPIERHVADPEAYKEFYRSDEATGYIPSLDEWLEPEKALSRAKWMAAWINTYCPKARVVDLGCFDGIIGIPLLRLCPEITYHGIDIYQRSLDAFQGRLEKHGLADRATLTIGDGVPTDESADVILWSEVVEHVADPVAALQALNYCLKPDGAILLTTPWGAFDKGHPRPETALGTPRDSRGHLRVVTPADLTAWAERAGLTVQELHKEDAHAIGTGDELNAVIRLARHFRQPSVNFAVRASLWDWNAYRTKGEGIGASEEMIIYLAEALVSDFKPQVFCPTPEEDVHDFVPYWPREHLRHVEEGKLVVSRAPGWARRLDEITREPLSKILWLQDAYYGDLSPETAALYDKIVVVSEWHKKAMNELHGVPLDKMAPIYNFVVAEHFDAVGALPRKRDRFVYASSPDRGVVRCLEVWPQIRDRLPEAELHIYYGWRGCERLGLNNLDAGWTRRYETARRAFEKLRRQPGVHVHGMVGHKVFAAELMRSGVWLHPSLDVDGQPFYETCCLNAVKARAGGCVAVCAPYAALEETAADPSTYFIDPRDTDGLVRAAVAATEPDEDYRKHVSARAIERFRREVFLPTWKDLLK